MEVKKNPEADLEKQRSTLILLGLVASTALILVVMEWAKYEFQEDSMGDLDLDMMEEEIIPPSATPPPPPPPPPAPTTVFEIVEDEEEIEEEIEIDDLEIDEDTQVEFIEEVEEVNDDQVFTIVEQMPSFPGGEAELFKYLGKNVKYPQMAQDAGLQGVVFLTFLVDKDGEVKNVKVLRGIGGGCDEEAIRVVKSMPKWKAGRQRGKPVKVQFNLPIKFTLK